MQPLQTWPQLSDTREAVGSSVTRGRDWTFRWQGPTFSMETQTHMWYSVSCKATVMSSCMSSDSSLAVGRDTVTCLALTSIFLSWVFRVNFYSWKLSRWLWTLLHECRVVQVRWKTTVQSNVDCHKGAGKNCWFTEWSPTTAVYDGLQGRRQLTGRWTGTCWIRSCSGDSSGHSCRIFARYVVCGNRVTELQNANKIRDWLERVMSSMQLTMTIRNRHTPTTFTSIQFAMTIRNPHTSTTFNYPYSHSLTNEHCSSRVSR